VPRRRRHRRRPSPGRSPGDRGPPVVTVPPPVRCR
jgi:hypothetical protein